jgi:hypothetical protein
MGIFRDLYNTAMAIPSNPNADESRQTSGQSKKLDLRGGAYKDSSRFDSDFRHRVREDLEGTLKDYSARSAVADIFHQSRGGSGITKQEVKEGLKRLVEQGKLNEDQMWAVRKKYGIF